MRFLWAFLASVAILIGGLATVLTIVNPRREFSGRAFPALNPNSRRLKAESFVRYNAVRPVDGVILGSSRSMKLPPLVFTTLTRARYFNFGVFVGTVEDNLAIFRYAARRAPRLNTIILGVEPEVLSSESVPLPELAHTLVLEEAREGRTFTPLDRLLRRIMMYKEALTVSYLADTWKAIRLAPHPPEPINTFDLDGTLECSKWDRARAAGQFDWTSHYNGCAQAELAFFARYKSVSRTKLATLDSLLAETSMRGIHVVLWVPPIYPALAATIMADSLRRHNRNQAIAAIFALQRPNVTFVDVSDVAALASPAHWYDCFHFDGVVAQTLAMRLAAAAAKDARRRMP